jgi:hypothetical protein
VQAQAPRHVDEVHDWASSPANHRKLMPQKHRQIRQQQQAHLHISPVLSSILVDATLQMLRLAYAQH